MNLHELNDHELRVLIRDAKNVLAMRENEAPVEEIEPAAAEEESDD